ncbi:lipoprotein [Mycobacterium lentiflavum]|uniref:Lipoprotein n=1 Tax=Mycobacterium lentiflavum TaxID=141349 RepID=A0A0E4GX36_MYCLN|nr:lipoprotein [Mycobacterium lentiflavum]
MREHGKAAVAVKPMPWRLDRSHSSTEVIPTCGENVSEGSGNCWLGWRGASRRNNAAPRLSCDHHRFVGRSGYDPPMKAVSPLVATIAAAAAQFIGACPPAHADQCNSGAVKPDGGGKDGYFTCVGGAWVHTVPTFDPDSADGYGPNQVLPPFCIRFPAKYSCPTGTPSASAAASIPGEGTFRIGVDIPPGTYKSLGGSSPGRTCYWFRHATVGGSNDVLDSGSSTGQQYVTIAPTDGTFETSFCQPWATVS